MSDTVLEIRNLSKLYRLGEVGTGTLSHDLNRWWARIRGKEDPFAKVGQVNRRDQKAESDYVWALKDVNLDVKRGEILGIIGANGAGKSTLLKLISRITSPTTGDIRVRGRIASLLEVGTGMHPEMTGRENIYLNGAILGMRRREIAKRFDEIIDFAGCELFVDTPVKRYSSGMRVRLGFAVAAFLEPDILIVDEVLAVGDAEFQRKALGKMQDVSRNGGRTVLFVSHNLTAVESFCHTGFCLARGQVAVKADIQTVIQSYLRLVSESQNQGRICDRTDRGGNGTYRVTHIALGGENSPPDVWQCGSPAYIDVVYEKHTTAGSDYVEIALGLCRSDGGPLLYLGTKCVRQDARISGRQNTSRCVLPRVPLEPGEYTLNCEIKSNGVIADHVARARAVQVVDGDFYGSGVIWPYGGFLTDYHWEHSPEGDAATAMERHGR